MPKKESTEEFFARSRGKGSGIKSEIVNGKKVKKDLQPGTKKNYTRALARWDQFELEHPRATPDDIETSKDWARCIAYGIVGAYDDDTAGLGSVVRSWKDLTAGWQWAERKPKIDPEVVITISNFIKGPLQKEIGLRYRKRERKYGTMIHFIHLGTQLWSNDWHPYRKPRTRLEVWGQLQMQVFTSARVGEFIQSNCRPGSGRGLYYRDITFGVFRNEDGRAEFAMQVVRDAKNMTFKPDKRPEHSLHEGLQPRPLFCNPILTYLAKFIAKGVFRDYKTMDELLSLDPLGDEMFQLHWDSEVLNLPFFQKEDGEIDTANIFSKRVRDLGFRSGYELPPTIHDFRAEGLFLIDKLYSTAQRMKHGGHTDENTHRDHYAPNNAGTDGQGSYFGDKLRSIVNDRFRSMTLCRNPELWQSLPAEKQHELESSPEFTAIEQELEALSLDPRDDSAITDRRKELRTEKRKLIAEELRKCRKLQPSRIPSNLGENNLIGYHQTIFSRVRALMPERDRLASSLFTVAPIRSEEGRAVLRDMISLYQQETEVAVRPGLEPEKCLCLPTESKRKIVSKPAAQRWRHIYGCYRKSLRATCGFAELCFFCSEWVMGKDQWENHCQVHLDGHKPLPAQCDPLFYGGTLASPGICPFCLDDATLSAAERMHQFHDKVEWRDHISDHFGIFEKYVGSLHEGILPKCPVSRSHCPDVFVSAQQVKFHLQNNHGAEFVKRAKKSRPLDEVDARCPKTKRVRSVIKHEPDTDVGECSKPAYEFVYQTAEQWCRKGPNASNPAAIRSPPSSTPSTAPSTAPSTPPSLNSRASTPITDACGSTTHTPVPQIPNNANGNIDPLLLSMPDTAAPVGDNTIRSSPRQSFTITSCESNSVTESSEVCNIASEYDVIEVEDLTDLDEESQALEAGESLTHVATAPRAFITPADDSDWLDLSTIRDTLPEEKPSVESTDVLAYEAIATEKGGRKCFNEDFVFVGDSLDPDLRNILDREELLDSHTSGAHSSPGNGSTEGIPTSHQGPEYQQLSEQAVQETRPSAVDPEDNQFEVERVIDDQVVLVGRGKRKKMITQYWVKWKGYPEDDNSWVSEADMHEDLIQAYREVQTSA